MIKNSASHFFAKAQSKRVPKFSPKFWLFKTEPNCYSWTSMQKDQITPWDGVRNYTARNHMQQMQVGDIGYFYHTGSERKIVGLVKVCRTYYPDSSDERFGQVDVQYLQELERPVSLLELKQISELASMQLFKQGRLSVVPVEPHQAEIINQLILNKPLN